MLGLSLLFFLVLLSLSWSTNSSIVEKCFTFFAKNERGGYLFRFLHLQNLTYLLALSSMAVRIALFMVELAVQAASIVKH